MILSLFYGEMSKAIYGEIKTFTQLPRDPYEVKPGEDEKEIVLGDFESSFNFVIKCNEKSGKFDWFDNPFISAAVYEKVIVKNKPIIRKAADVELQYCKDANVDLEHFLGNSTVKDYHGADSICLKNKDKF